MNYSNAELLIWEYFGRRPGSFHPSYVQRKQTNRSVLGGLGLFCLLIVFGSFAQRDIYAFIQNPFISSPEYEMLKGSFCDH